MSFIVLRRLFWQACRIASGIGPVTLGAFFLFFACLVSYVALVHPINGREAVLRQAVADGSSRPVVARPTDPLNRAQQLAQFYRFFPEPELANDLLGRIYSAAAAQGLVLEQGDYVLTHEPDGALTRYDITLPLKGGYPQVRKFVSQALHDVPSLALSNISFVRQKIDEPVVDAEVRFTLYVGRQ